jgi:hypothetical protein
MVDRKIKNNQVIINDIPFEKWTPDEWALWRNDTTDLIKYCGFIGKQLQSLAYKKGWAN